MTKYKYYLKKPKSEIIKDILTILIVSGMVCIAATSPYFGTNIVKGFKKMKRYNKKKVYNTFYKLRKSGCIRIKSQKGQIYISLTEKGKKKAGWLQIDSLKIKRPRKWDRKWRLVAFDISQPRLIYREALRGKLKELGFYLLQKSIWVHPFDCRDEVNLLRDFFSFSEDEMKLIVANDIGRDRELKEIFKL
jgi:DNA-binding transcriptional regulator PaaX